MVPQTIKQSKSFDGIVFFTFIDHREYWHGGHGQGQDFHLTMSKSVYIYDSPLSSRRSCPAS